MIIYNINILSVNIQIFMLAGKKNRIITGYTPNFVCLDHVTKYRLC